jgi:hypothetical protein
MKWLFPWLGADTGSLKTVGSQVVRSLLASEEMLGPLEMVAIGEARTF